VLAGPACRRPAAALPRLPLSLPHPPLTPGPIAARPHLSVVSHRVARVPSPSPVRQPASATSACCRLRLRHLEPFRPRHPAADPALPPSFSLSPSTTWHSQGDAPPHFPLAFSPACPPNCRSHWCLTPLRSEPEPELPFPPLVLQRLRAHLAGSCHGDPSSSLVPARAPSSSAIIGEHDRALSLHPNGLTPHLLPPSPTLQGHTVDVIHHRSCLAIVERHRPKHPPRLDTAPPLG
jgi:hypothetical protein